MWGWVVNLGNNHLIYKFETVVGRLSYVDVDNQAFFATEVTLGFIHEMISKHNELQKVLRLLLTCKLNPYNRP